MTAEVCVVSPLGVALAADSAVTVGKAKVYASAEKLFQMAEAAPVAVMVHGVGSLLGVPWETAIKLFRQKLGAKTFDTLEGYADSFRAFLESEAGTGGTLYPAATQEAFVTAQALMALQFVRDEAIQKVQKALPPEGEPQTEAQVQAAVTAEAVAQLEETRSYANLERLPPNFMDVFRDRYGALLDQAIEGVFGGPQLNDELRQSLRAFLVELFSRRRLVGIRSGVVIAGFGEKERFPSVIEYSIKGVAGQTLLIDRIATSLVSGGTGGWVVPFAMGERMVHTFLKGLDPQFRRFIEDSTDTLVRGVGKLILDEVEKAHPEDAAALRERLAPRLDQLLKDLFAEWEKHSQDQYVSPVMDLVFALPKDELAGMAEALVNLTKFKSRISPEQESVGGPIDVAVITKGDGFVWVKRKHYFQAELNPRVLARYLRQPREEA